MVLKKEILQISCPCKVTAIHNRIGVNTILMNEVSQTKIRLIRSNLMHYILSCIFSENATLFIYISTSKTCEVHWALRETSPNHLGNTLVKWIPALMSLS